MRELTSLWDKPSPQLVTQYRVVNPETIYIQTTESDLLGCMFVHKNMAIIKKNWLSVWEWGNGIWGGCMDRSRGGKGERKSNLIIF